MTNPFAERLTRSIDDTRGTKIQRGIWLASAALTALALLHLIGDPFLAGNIVTTQAMLYSMLLLMLAMMVIPLVTVVPAAMYVYTDSHQAAFDQLLLTNLPTESIAQGYFEANRLRLHPLRLAVWAIWLPLALMTTHVMWARGGIPTTGGDGITYLCGYGSGAIGLAAIAVIMTRLHDLAIRLGVVTGLRASDESALGGRLLLIGITVAALTVVGVPVAVMLLRWVAPILYFVALIALFSIGPIHLRKRAIRAVEARRSA